ncbi:MAG TPA: tetratricopeptide repeat protein, partial [Bacteroidetes bacterium]|nr:tetratricopeptide repeat protein [Bacteroidota bacterium]
MKKYVFIFLSLLILGGCAHFPGKSLERSKIQTPPQKAYNPFALSSFIDGVFADLNRDYQRAALDYNEALTWDSTSATIYAALGQDYLKIGRVRIGLKLLKKAVRLEPDNPEYPSILVAVYGQLRDFNSAIPYQEALVKLKPNDVSGHYHLATLYLLTKQDQKAAEEFNKVYELSGKSPDALGKISEFYLQARKYDQAIQTYQKLIQLQPDKEENYINLGEMYQMKGDTATAVTFLESALKDHPAFSKVRNFLSDIYMNQNQWKKALTLWQALKEEKPNDIQPYLQIAELHLAEGDTAKSIEMYGKIRQLFKDNWHVYYNLGRVYLERKNFTDAIANLKMAIQKDTSVPQSWLLLGLAYLQNGKNQEAEKNFADALKVFPGEPRLNFYYGAVLNQNKKYKQAVLPLQKLLQTSPNYVDGLRELAYSYLNLKQYDNAEKTCLRALKINPNNLSVVLILAS